MHHAQLTYPHTTALAAGVGARIGGGLTFGRLSGMGMRTPLHSIDRGILR